MNRPWERGEEMWWKPFIFSQDPLLSLIDRVWDINRLLRQRLRLLPNLFTADWNLHAIKCYARLVKRSVWDWVRDIKITTWFWAQREVVRDDGLHSKCSNKYWGWNFLYLRSHCLTITWGTLLSYLRVIMHVSRNVICRLGKERGDRISMRMVNLFSVTIS